MKTSDRFSTIYLFFGVLLLFPALAFGQMMGGFEDGGGDGTYVEIHGPDVPATASTATVGGETLLNFEHMIDPMDETEYMIKGRIAQPIASWPAGQYTVTIDGADFGSVQFDHFTGGGGGPMLMFMSGNLEFGNVDLGQSPSMTFDIKNDGDADLNVSNISVPAPFSVSPDLYASIPSGDTRTVTVTFSPTAAQDYYEDVQFQSDDPGSPHYFPVHGTGQSASGPPMIEVSPDPLYFGDVQVGSSMQYSVWVYNSGDETLTLSSITTSGPFAFIGSTPMNIGPQSGDDVYVEFNPATSGTHNGTLTITSNASNFPTISVGLEGYGEEAAAGGAMIDVSPNPLNFGNVDVGSSMQNSVWVYNSGDETLNISTITTSGPFSFTGSTPMNIGPQSGDDVYVEFNPTSAGTHNGTLTITSNASNSPSISVGLEGYGEEAGPPPISVDGFSIMPAPEGTDGTEFWVYGNGFTSSNINSMDIYRDGSIYLNDISSGNMEIDTYQIVYTHAVDYMTLTPGDYYAKLDTDEGVFDSPTYTIEEPEPQIWSGHFMEGSSAGQTDVTMHGMNIPEDGTATFSLTISSTSYNLQGVTIGPFTDGGTTGGQEIKGYINLSFDTLPPDTDITISVSVTTSEGTFNSTDVMMYVQEPEPDVWSGEFMLDYDTGDTHVRIWGTDALSSVTAFSVKLGGVFISVTSLNITSETHDGNVNWSVEGVIDVDIFNLTEGDFDISITNSEGTNTHTVYMEVHGTEPDLWGGAFTEGAAAGQTEVHMQGMNIPTDASLSLTVSGTSYDLQSMSIGPVTDGGAANAQEITGYINLSFDSLTPEAEMTISVSLTSATAGSHDFTNVMMFVQPAQPDVYSGEFMLEHATQETRARIWGTDALSTVTAFSVKIGGTFIPVTGLNVYSEDHEGNIDWAVEGTIAVDIFSLTAGNFDISITNAESTETYTVKMEVYGTELEIMHAMFGAEAGPSVRVDMFGANFPAIANISSVTVGSFSVTGLALEEFTYTDPPDDGTSLRKTSVTGDTETVLTGIISGQPISAFSSSEYNLTIVTSDSTYSFPTMQFQMPEVFQGGFYESPTGTIEVYFGGHGIPADLTSVTISNGSGVQVSLTSILVTDSEYGNRGKEVDGYVEIDFDLLTEGNYTITCISTDHGTLTFSDVPFEVEPVDPTDIPIIENMTIESDPANPSDAIVTITGQNFDDLTLAEIISLRFTYGDSLFSDASTVFTINVTAVGLNSDNDSEMTGTVTGLDPSTLPKGTYWLEIFVDDDPRPFVTSFYFSTEGRPEFFDLYLSESGTDTKVEVYGENLGQIDPADINSFQITKDDITFNTPPVYDVTNVTVTEGTGDDDDVMTGYIVGTAYSTFTSGQYYAAVSATCLVDAGYPDPTIFPFYHDPGAPSPDSVIETLVLFRAGTTTGVIMAAEVLSDEGITAIQISQDATFAGTVYDVLNITYAPNEGDAGDIGEIVLGSIAESIDNMTQGDYYVKLTTATESVINGPYEVMWPAVLNLEVEEGSAASISDVRILGVELTGVTAAQISSDEDFAAASTVYDVSITSINQGAGDMGLDELLGTIAVDFDIFPEGYYYVQLTTASGVQTFSEWWLEGGTGGGPVITDYNIHGIGLFRFGSVVGIQIPGDGFDDAGVSAIEVSSSRDFSTSYTLQGLTIQAGVGSDVTLEHINGTLNTTFASLSAGDYYLRITSSGGTNDHGPYPVEWPFVWHFGLSASPVAGISNVIIQGAELPTITGAEFSMDQSFSNGADMPTYTVDAGFTVTAETGIVGQDQLIGTVPVDYNTIEPGWYYVQLETATGETTDGPWSIRINEGPTTGPNIFFFDFKPIGAGLTEFYIMGDGFDGLDLAIQSIEVSSTPDFSTSYTVTGLQYRFNVNGTTNDEITGMINQDFSAFTAGSYYMRVTLSTGNVITYPFDFFGGAGESYLYINPFVLNFLDVAVNGNSTLSFNIMNDGFEPVDISFSTPDGPFTVVPASYTGLAVGADTDFQVTFSPTTEGLYTDTLFIDDGSGDPELGVLLTGYGGSVTTGPKISVDLTEFDFGDVTFGTQVTQDIWVYNEGTETLEITKMEIEDYDEFWVEPQVLSVSPGDSAMLTVTFMPQSEQQYISALLLYTNDPLNPVVMIGMTGNGIMYGTDFPMIFDIYVTARFKDSIRVKWNTSEPSTTEIGWAEEDFWMDGPQDSVVTASLRYQHMATLEPLVPDSEYRFWVRATNAGGNSSPPVPPEGWKFKTLAADDIMPPVIVKQPTVMARDINNVLINFVTDEPTYAYIEYSVDSLWNIADHEEYDDPELTRDHYFLVDNLELNTLYRAVFGVSDASGNGPVMSSEFTFRTLESANFDPPVFTEFPLAQGIDTSFATIKFRTNVPTIAAVRYTKASLFEGESSIIMKWDSTLTVDHRVNLTNLEPSTAYTFEVGILDANGIGPVISPPSTFVTSGEADDMFPVIVQGPFFHIVDTSKVMIKWYTNEISNSIVWYNEGSQLQSAPTEIELPDLVMAHEVMLSGLTPGTEYSFKVGSVDSKGNGPVEGPVMYFYTPAGFVDEPPFFTHHPEVVRVDTNAAEIKFATNKLTTFKLFYKEDDGDLQNGEFDVMEDFTLSTEHRAYISGLSSVTGYVFYVEIFDASGGISMESPWQYFYTPGSADNLPPKFQGFPTVLDRDTSQVTIQWFTDEASTSVIEYGEMGGDAANAGNVYYAENTVLTTDHIVVLTGLKKDTRYWYIVKSTDSYGNMAVSPTVFEFKTLGVNDVEPPIIVNIPFVTDFDTNRVVVKWETNEMSTSIVEYAEEGDFDDDALRIIETDYNLTRFHGLAISGLEPGVTYEFRVGSTDGRGNGPTYSEIYDFRTLETADFDPPVIFGSPDIYIIDTSSVVIEWYSDESSNSRVDYYPVTNPAMIQIRQEPALVEEHAVLLRDLMPGTLYIFNIFSTDGNGNGPTGKGPFTFSTPQTADNNAPVFIQYPFIAHVDTSVFVVEWMTDERANSILEYYAEDAPEDTFTVDEQELSFRHGIFVSGLMSGTEYQARAMSYDAAGNGPVTSEWFGVRTREAADFDPPRFKGFPNITDMDTNSVTIVWESNEPVVWEFAYGLSSTWPINPMVLKNQEFDVEHEITLTNLLLNESYKFQIRLTDRAGNRSHFSGEQEFRTLGIADVFPPEFVGLPYITNIDTDRVTVEWETNEGANSVVLVIHETDTIKVSDQKLTDFHSVFVRGLTSDTEYFVYASSVDAKGNGPTVSYPMNFRTRASADVMPPAIIGFPQVTGMDTNSVTILWRTNEAANNIIEYAPSGEWPNNIEVYVDENLVIDHNVMLSGLLPGTEYRFRVGSMDASRNGPTFSYERSFMTAAGADLTPPAIIGVPFIIGVDTTKFTVVWATNEIATSIVQYYKTSAGSDSMMEVVDNKLVQMHDQLVSNLRPNTEYTYIAGSMDAAGNGPVYSREFRFKTPGRPDNVPPRIIGIPIAEGIDTNSVTILWSTNEASNSIVEIAPNADWLTAAHMIVTDQGLVNNHNLLITDLMSNVEYRFRVGSADEKGNGPTYSFERTFRTRTSADLDPPVIVGFPEATDLDTNRAVIVWETDEPGNSIVYIIEAGTDHEFMVEDGELVKEHELLIDELRSDTQYIVRVASIDASNNGPTVSRQPLFFRTLAAPDTKPPVFFGLPRITNLDTTSVTLGIHLDEEAEVTVIIAPTSSFANPDSQIYVRNPELMDEHIVDIFDLIPGLSYKFKVTATDGSGNGPSETPVFEFGTPAAPDRRPPVIVGFPVVAGTDTGSAYIKYLTDENANTELRFWIKGDNTNELEVVKEELVRRHEIFVGNLTQGTEYEAYVRSFDRSGNGPTDSELFTFATLTAADDDPPVIIGVPSLEGVDTSSATIVFRTDEEGTTIIEYMNVTAPDDTIYYEDQALVLDHRAFLTNLIPDMHYLFRIGSIDGKGNGPVYSPLFGFKTPSAPDTRAPIILGVPSERNTDTTSVTVIWGTDEPSSSKVDFRTVSDTTVVNTFRDDDMVAFHEVFVSGLIPGTEYQYRVSSTDAFNNGPSYYDGNPNRWAAFRTPETPDIAPPQLTFWPIIIGLTHHSASVKFKTNEISYAKVNFGAEEPLVNAIQEFEGKTTHVIRLTNLADSTLYFYRVEGRDIKGNSFLFPPEEDAPLSFMTRVQPVVADSTPPQVVEGPVEVDIEADRMTILWMTNKMSNSTVDYGTDTSLTETKSLDNTNLVIGHRVKLTNLLADTTYYYRIRSRGDNNIEYASEKFNIRTLTVADTFTVNILEGPLTTFVQDENATIEWLTDKNAMSQVDYGTVQGTFDFSIKENEIDGVKHHQMKLSELIPGTEYFYQVASIGTNGREARSDVFSFITPALPDTIPPKIIAGPDPTMIENSSVTVEWITDEPSTSVIQYGLRDAAGPVYTTTVWIDADASGVHHHKAVLTGLTPGTEYDFKVKSADLSPGQNWVHSRNKRFMTLELQNVDNIPPTLISGPMVYRSDKTAVFEWETDELSDSFVYVRELDSLGNVIETNFRKYGDENKVIVHIVTVPNLTPGSNYEFEIASRDFAGNQFTWPTATQQNSIEQTLSFRKTNQPPGGGGSFFTNQDPDTQVPIITDGPTIVSKTSATITVEWKTDERSDSFVEFGLDTLYGDTKGDGTDVTEHSITLTNLSAGTTYNFKVNSTDPNNNGPIYSLNSAVSTEAEADDTPPKITSGPVVESITDDQVTIIWETDENSDTYVEYGLTDAYGSTRISTTDEKVHSMTLTNLTASTEYHYRVGSTDISDNGPTNSADLTFSTAGSPDTTPPVITSVAADAVTDVAATISYDTDELGDTFINYGLASDDLSESIGFTQDVTSHELTLTNLSPSTTYHYKVGSIDKSDNETLDEIRTFTTEGAPDTTPPATPTGLDVIAGDAKVILLWDANTESDLAGYNIYRSTDGTYQLIASLVADTFYYDNGLTNDTEFRYKITAADASSNPSVETAVSSDTPAESKSPQTPALFFPIDGKHLNVGEINLSIENVTVPVGRDEVVYEFVIAEESDFFSQVAYGENVAAGDGKTIWISNLTLTDGMTYYWKSRAFDGYFYSDWSETRYFVADAQQATSVELVGFWGKEFEGDVVLEWQTTSENNVAGYNIYRSFLLDKGFQKITPEMIDSGDENYSYTDRGLEAGLKYYYKLEYINEFGAAHQFDAIEVRILAPETYKLHQNYPNPFNPETTIKFDLPKPGIVHVKIYNILGQEVRSLLSEDKKAGFHSVMWDGRDNFGRQVASGMYIYRIACREFTRAKKMVLLR